MTSGYIVQSVLLKRDKFENPTEARNWLMKHNYKYHKIHITPEFYRFRQIDPQVLTFHRFRTIKLGDVGELIVAYD